MIITSQYLKQHLSEIFVFGDNNERRGKGGAAILRDEPNTYGFITKKIPSHSPSAYYTCNEYLEIYHEEIYKLKKFIESNPNKIFLISKLGAGLANRYKIFENIISPNIKKDLSILKNIRFLW